MSRHKPCRLRVHLSVIRYSNSHNPGVSFTDTGMIFNDARSRTSFVAMSDKVFLFIRSSLEDADGYPRMDAIKDELSS